MDGQETCREPLDTRPSGRSGGRPTGEDLSQRQNREACPFYPAVELLIPVYRPGGELMQLLGRMAKQSYPLDRVHLLVTAEEKEFEAVAETCHRAWRKPETELLCTRIDPEAFDHGGTRHRGASESQADLLLFMTQDALPADDWLVERLVEPFVLFAPDRSRALGQPVVAAAYARQLPNETCHPIERYTRGFNYPGESRVKTKADLPVLGIKTYFCSNVCAMYRRDIYEQMGGFIRHTIFNEDMIYAAGIIQAGYGIAYAAEARVIHSHNYSAGQQFRRNFDLAVSQADHPEIFEGVPSEGEGIRMVKQTAGYLCRTGRFYLAPKLIWQSGWKYMGYLLGKRYRKLPHWMVMRFTMNPRYWTQEGKRQSGAGTREKKRDRPGTQEIK